MKPYIIVNLEITDPVAFEDYRAQVPAMIAAYGGRYLVRGGALEVLEGENPFGRVVILEFPSLERARAFYGAPEYQPLIALRQRSARATLVLIEGVSAS